MRTILSLHFYYIGGCNGKSTATQGRISDGRWWQSSRWWIRRAGFSGRLHSPRISPWRSPPSLLSRSIPQCACFLPEWIISDSGQATRPGSSNQVLVGKYYREEKHPSAASVPDLRAPGTLVLRHPKTTIAIALVLVATTVPVYFQLGSEFMPPLNEGTILYMPTTLPGISVAQAQMILQHQDK